jgi:hypothetical protein
MYHLKLFHAGDGAAHLHINVEGAPGVLSATHLLSSGDSHMFEIAETARILAQFKPAPIPEGVTPAPQPVLRRIIVQKARGDAPIVLRQNGKVLSGKGDAFRFANELRKLYEVGLPEAVIAPAKKHMDDQLPVVMSTHDDKPTIFEVVDDGSVVDIRPQVGGGLDV